MSGLKVLISGSSIAGPALAFWLLRSGADVTVVERDATLRLTGQSIDLREAAIDIIQAMDLEQTIRDKTTKEQGIEFVNSKGERIGLFEASGDVKNQSFTSEFEIFRGDLASIFFDATKEKAKYIFGDYIKDIKQDVEGAHVIFANGTTSALYDVVVAADGMGSKVRAMALNTTTREHIKSLNLFICYFTMHQDLLGGKNFAKVYNASKGRSILLRPDPQRRTRANLNICVDDRNKELLLKMKDAMEAGPDAIKRLFREYFTGAGWIYEEVLSGMDTTDDFYASEIAQIKTQELFKGRIALLGDAGYCPSPLTGMGTSLAVIGAYILAGELMTTPQDVNAALTRYQEIMLPYAQKVQKLPPGVPGLANPQSEWGITVLRNIVGFVSWSGLPKLLMKVAPAFSGKKFQLPQYSWPEQLT